MYVRRVKTLQKSRRRFSTQARQAIASPFADTSLIQQTPRYDPPRRTVDPLDPYAALPQSLL